MKQVAQTQTKKKFGKYDNMVVLFVRISVAQDEELDALQAKLTGSKSKIIREALQHYIGLFHEKGVL